MQIIQLRNFSFNVTHIDDEANPVACILGIEERHPIPGLPEEVQAQMPPAVRWEIPLNEMAKNALAAMLRKEPFAPPPPKIEIAQGLIDPAKLKMKIIT